MERTEDLLRIFDDLRSGGSANELTLIKKPALNPTEYLNLAQRVASNIESNEALVSRMDTLSARKEFSNDPTIEMAEISDLFHMKVAIVQRDFETLKRMTEDRHQLVRNCKDIDIVSFAPFLRVLMLLKRNMRNLDLSDLHNAYHWLCSSADASLRMIGKISVLYPLCTLVIFAIFLSGPIHLFSPTSIQTLFISPDCFRDFFLTVPMVCSIYKVSDGQQQMQHYKLLMQVLNKRHLLHIESFKRALKLHSEHVQQRQKRVG